jgi:6-phosphogluconolactonase
MPEKRIKVFPDLETLSREAAIFFLQHAVEAVERKGRFSVALAGGSTPRILYRLLSTPEFSGRIPWPDLHLFWGDERCVPPEHEESNYGMAYAELLSGISLSKENIHRMRGEIEPEEGARMYERELIHFLKDGKEEGLDLVLLGLGQDGHTASLFPYAPALKETERMVVHSYSRERGQDRLTLTLPFLNRSQTILFLVAGEGKAKILERLLKEGGGLEEIPARGVEPAMGEVRWFLDQAAASRLSGI